MNKNKITAHVGLGLVTYIPLVLYILYTLIMTSDSAEVFASGFLAFLGFFAMTMLIFGWIFLITSLIISIRGLVRRDNTAINAATLMICALWLIAFYWIVTHFA